MTAGRAVALACAVAGLAAAPAAAAAPGWTSAPVSEAGALVPTGLAFAAGGGVLTWEAREPGHRPHAKLTGLALRSPLGAWTRGPDVPGVTWGLARVHPVGARTVMVGMRAYAFGAYNRARWEVVTAAGRLDGTFGAVRELARPVSWVGSAAGGRGEAFAAWLPRDDSGLRVQRLRPTRGPAHRLSPPGAARPLLVAGPRGHVLAAWVRGRRIEARMRTPQGHWGGVRRIALAGPVPEELHGAVRRIARAGPVPEELHGAVSGAGRAIVAWGAADLYEDRPPRLQFAAATSRGGGRWTTHRLESFSGFGGFPPTVRPAFDVGGRGLVAWAGAGAVKLARPDGRGLRSAAVADGVAVDALAVSPAGEAALALSAPLPAQGPGPGPFVVSAPRGGGLGAPVDVGAPGTTPLPGAQLAFDPAGRPTVAWVALEAGAGRVWTATRASP